MNVYRYKGIRLEVAWPLFAGQLHRKNTLATYGTTTSSTTNSNSNNNVYKRIRRPALYFGFDSNFS